MPKMIYIPQGHGATLIQAAPYLGLDGLYTDKFSSCNILICASPHALLLVHIDSNTSADQILSTLKQINEPKNITLIFRAGVGDFLKSRWMDYFSENSIKITSKTVDARCVGISLSFADDTFTIWDKRPADLIHHPKEQALYTRVKMMEVIGKREKIATQEFKKYKWLIFDKMAWQSYGENDFKIDCSHPYTLNEMNYFSKNDSFADIFKHLVMIFSQAQGKAPTAQQATHNIIPIIQYVENYFHDYDYEFLLGRNMTDLNNKYIQNLDGEEAKAQRQNYQDHYHERKFYSDLTQENTQLQAKAKLLGTRAIEEYRSANYTAAFNLYLDAAHIYTYTMMNNESTLAVAYYNCGRSAFKAQKYQEASDFLNISLQLNNCEKTKQALSECTAYLPQASTASTARTIKRI